MAFLFGRRQTKSDIVKTTTDLLRRLRQPGQVTRVEEDLGRQLAQMKALLQGTHGTHLSASLLPPHHLTSLSLPPDQDPDTPTITTLVADMQTQDFFFILATSIHLLRFEPRKDSQTILSYALRFRPPSTQKDDESPALAHILDHRTEVIIALCRGYEHRESAMPCGVVLRELLKNEHVSAVLLHDESTSEDSPAIKLDDLDLGRPTSTQGVFWRFFDWIDTAAFEASTDAFSTFRELLTRHKNLAAQFLTINFEPFFQRYNSILIGSKSYVTKRQSIKLLGEILLDRANYAVMTMYVDKGEHLKLCMNLLKDERKMVQYEGFHVFKVFVANPNKSDSVKKILTQNKDRLLRFLPSFLEDRQDDDQFLDEKSFLVRQISLLGDGQPAPAATAAAAG